MTVIRMMKMAKIPTPRPIARSRFLFNVSIAQRSGSFGQSVGVGVVVMAPYGDVIVPLNLGEVTRAIGGEPVGRVPFLGGGLRVGSTVGSTVFNRGGAVEFIDMMYPLIALLINVAVCDSL
eukprot:scpid82784/ scgid34126/ 